MSNSTLVNYTLISPYKNSPRNNTIKKITIHHMAGNLSVETCGSIFRSRKASSNYEIGTDGRVGMYVEEKDRAWTSSNADNDNQAITIEVANDVCSGNWHISDTALAKLIELCVDICKRNSIAKLNFTGDKTGNLTMHKYFAATDCPGPYLESKFSYIADKVNKQLSENSGTVSGGTTVTSGTFNVGDTVDFTGTKHYTSANEASAKTCKPGKAKITAKYNGKHPYHLVRVSGGTSTVYGWVDAKDITGAVTTGTTSAAAATIKKGSTVKVKSGAKTYTGGRVASFVYTRNHIVKEISGNRVVITYGGVVVAAVKLADLTLIS